MKHPRVFISYSHDSPQHRRNIIDFAQELRLAGIDARLDAFDESSPPASWPMWMHRQIRTADYVIVVCTPTYKSRAEGEESERGTGAAWEGSIITLDLYQQTFGRPSKYIPVMVEERDEASIPYFLAGTTHYVIGDMGHRHLEPLIRRITSQPKVVPVRLGAVPTLGEVPGKGTVPEPSVGSLDPARNIADVFDSALLVTPGGVEAPPTRSLDLPFLDLQTLVNGLRAREVVIVAAEPRAGKSALLLNIALNASIAQNSRVLVFSPEMSAGEIASRLIAARADVDLSRIWYGVLREDETQRILATIESQARLPFYIDDSSVFTIDEMRRQTLDVAERLGRLDLIVLDGLQLLYQTGGAPIEVRSVARSLSDLARDIDAVVLLSAGLARYPLENQPYRGEYRTFVPVLADLRQSGILHKEADVVMFIYREDMHVRREVWQRAHPDRQPEEYPAGIAQIIVAKNAHGPTGTVHLRFRDRVVSFDDSLVIDRKK